MGESFQQTVNNLTTDITDLWTILSAKYPSSISKFQNKFNLQNSIEFISNYISSQNDINSLTSEINYLSTKLQQWHNTYACSCFNEPGEKCINRTKGHPPSPFQTEQ